MSDANSTTNRQPNDPATTRCLICNRWDGDIAVEFSEGKSIQLHKLEGHGFEVTADTPITVQTSQGKITVSLDGQSATQSFQELIEKEIRLTLRKVDMSLGLLVEDLVQLTILSPDPSLGGEVKCGE